MNLPFFVAAELIKFKDNLRRAKEKERERERERKEPIPCNILKYIFIRF